MASAFDCVYVLTVLLIFPFLTIVSGYGNFQLDTFYDTILHHQNQSNILIAKYTPPPVNHVNLSQLYQNSKLFENRVTAEVISQLFPILDEKEKYEGTDAFDEGIDLDFINLTIFHRYEDVKIGNKLPLLFTNQGPASATLMKYSQQTVNPYVGDATLCGSTVPGELKMCVSSLEDMIGFITDTMGKNVKPISTPAGKWQMYTISGEAKTIRHKVTGCHKKEFLPYAIYGCHHKENTEVRVVPLLGEDGTKLNAITICHMNTSSWDPHYLLFQLMKAKPGTPVCHFLATDDIIWITK